MSGPHGIARLLQSVALREGETVADFARRSGEPRSTAFALVDRLTCARLLERDVAGRLSAGSACGQLGFAAVGLGPAYFVAEALLPVLRDDTDATVVLSAGDGEERIVLMQRRALWHTTPFDPEQAASLDIHVAARGVVGRLTLQLRPDSGTADRNAAAACLARVVAAIVSALEREQTELP